MVINNTLKYSIIGIIVFLALLIAKKLYGFFKNGGNISNIFNSIKTEHGLEIKIPLLPENPSDIQDSQATQYAERLFAAMDRFGTDEETIFQILHPQRTANDIIKISNAFGFRRYFIGARATFLGSKLNLLDWLRAELSNSEFNKIKPLFEKSKLL